MKSSVLSIRDFRWLWTGSLFSYLAQWIQQTTLGWVAYDITGSAVLLGAILGVRAVPILLFAPFAGVAADRYSRRGLLLVSALLAVGSSFIFGAGLALGTVKVWHLFAFVVAAGIVNLLDRPARLTTVFDLVPRDMAMRAIALNTVSFSMARIVGPACAGYLIAWFGPAGNFFIQALIYLVAAALVLLIAFPARKIRARKLSAWTELLEGFRYAARDRAVRPQLVLGMVAYFLMAPAWSAVLPVFAKDVFNAGPQGLGIMLTAVGVGGTIGGAGASMLARANRQGWVQAGALLAMAAGLFGFALSPSLPLSLLFLAVSGGAEMVMVTSNQTMLQMCAPEAMRGRIAGLIQLYPAVISLGALMTGALIDLAGPRLATGMVALAAVLFIAGMLAGSARLRGLTLSEYRHVSGGG